MQLGVLRDYPLRLWQQQTEHIEDMLREFSLLLIGERSSEMLQKAPGQLIVLADMFHNRYGVLLRAINSERQEAVERGLDRMDSRVPLVTGTPQLLDEVHGILDAADEFCRQGELLLLPRSPMLLALSDWVRTELVTQYEGGPATPWPGPW